MSSITVDVADGVGHIVLSRPKHANAFDLPMARELGEAISRMEKDDVRVVLLTADGPRFCAGGDVSSFLAGEDPEAYLLELATVLEEHVRRLSLLPKPVVAAVQGVAAGAGLAFVLAADLVVAVPSTKFTMAYANIGLTPDCGVAYLLPRVVGLRRALSFTLERRVINAPEAREWGLVSSIDDDPETAANSLAATIAAGPATALGEARRLLRSSYDLPRAEHAVAEAETIASSVTTPEAQELIRVFTGG
ncbi:enoyl-CoA hydratase/isomerase family protein [Streptomyces sp. NPDC050625]|uniref:enoyl-CoA hydratase/isomerase family protein n=1 Tax=Streptomyces sp. NPDC050625 TaxID=3154629 RepID=UPI00343130DC